MTNRNTQNELELPTSQESDCDNNADSDTISISKLSDIDEYSILPIYMKMIRVFVKEFSLMLLLWLAYAVLSHSPSKIGKPPAAFPFFTNSSFVKDFYKGDISTIFYGVTDFDLAFFMFYAPWDAESQEVRAEFERTAFHMNKFVDFYAVNCWQPGSECRQKYNKVFTWPVLLAYTTHGRIIQYNGPKTSSHMIKFLLNVMQPYIRVSSQNEASRLEAQYDAVVLAAVDTRPGSDEFSAAYGAALKLMEKEQFSDVAFTIMNRDTISEYPYITLSLWNETLYFMPPNEFKTSEIVKWLMKSFHQLTAWSAPSGIKSQQLLATITSPALVLFTPKNPFISIDYYSLLKEVAQEYYHCDELLPFKSIYINSLRLRLKKLFDLRLEKCATRQNKPESLITYIQNIKPTKWINSTCRQRVMQEQCYLDAHLSSDQCTALCGACKFGSVSYKTSMINDDYSNDLRKVWEMIDCKVAHLALQFHPISYVMNDAADFNNVTGLSCRTNSTLSFVALDSIEYHQFAERFGIEILKQPNKTALLLINDKEEVHHIYDDHVNDQSMREFVLNFTKSNLPRALLSSSLTFQHTHTYPLSNDYVNVLELNSNNFLSTVMQPDKIVIVYYHSKQCAFCNGIAYTFLFTAKTLSQINFIQFARIDGDLNSLPWEFTMETYPTILFFPIRRKSETRAFPHALPINVNNLISFVLNNLEPELKLHVMWSICNQTLHILDANECLASLRNENLAIIEYKLKEWRKADPRNKQRILYQLQHLKNLHFDLATGGNERIQHRLERFNYLFKSKQFVKEIV